MRWVWDADMLGALMVDEMGLGKTFTSVAAARICKLVTENVVLWLPQSMI
jgi:SNF2 family DNA or RNA helicase